MTLKELVTSKGLWLGRRERARANHKRYVWLSERSKGGTDRHKKLMARRAHWWREYKEAAHKVAVRDREIKRRSGATKVSRAGLEMLVREEGLIPYAYEDPDKRPKGWATFGVGHLIPPPHRGVTEADRRKWGTKANPKSHSYVIDVLDDDLDEFEDTVNAAVKVKISQNQFDALLSLCFNIGRAAFAGSSVVRKLNAGDRRGAADAFLMWDNPSILRPRRVAERALFLK